MSDQALPTCPQCGKEVTPPRKGSKAGKRFCSRSCTTAYHNRTRKLKPNAIFDCAYCGKHVERWVAPSEQAKHPPRYCGRTCARKDLSGARHHAWTGGRNVEADGYVEVHAPDHPHANQRGYVPEHRLVMERELGRYLRPEEVVHHIDDDPGNNDPANLQLFPNQATHKLFHEAQRQRDGAGRYLPRSS